MKAKNELNQTKRQNYKTQIGCNYMEMRWSPLNNAVVVFGYNVRPSAQSPQY